MLKLQPGLLCRQIDSVMDESCFEASPLDAQIHGQLGSSLSQLTKKHIPRRPCCSLNLLALRRQTARATLSLKFLRQKDEGRGKWQVPCVYDSLQHLQDTFKSSCQFPLPAVVCFATQIARPTPTIVQDHGLPIRRRSRRSQSQERLRRGAR